MAEKKQKAGYDSKITDKKRAVVAELKDQLTREAISLKQEAPHF